MQAHLYPCHNLHPRNIRNHFSFNMSHPAASIKSIFSGRVNLTDTEYDDASTTRDSYADSRQEYQDDQEYPDRVLVNIGNFDSDAVESQQDERYERSSDFSYTKPALRDPRDADSYSVSSKNLRIMALQKGSAEPYDQRSSSTNISLASSGSDYQQSFIPDQDAYLLDSSQIDVGADEISRPVSRNSTTSCLLTTATKDGIEGKKLHRHGPTPYFSSVIADMISHQRPLATLRGTVDPRGQKQEPKLPPDEKSELV